MGWLRSNHPDDRTRAGIDSDPLGEHHLTPPPTERLELQKAVIRNPRDHKADLVHMARQHDLGTIDLADFAPDAAAEMIDAYFS
jgi:hypothetical protein